MERDRPGATGGNIKCKTGEEEKAEEKTSERTVVEIMDYLYVLRGVQKSKLFCRI